MSLIPGKRYRAEFTQLPYGFINDNTALQTLIRMKGLQYLAMYIAIQDRMANHTEEDFTLSYSEAIAEPKAYLQQYSMEDADIKVWLDDLIDAEIVEQRVFVNAYTDIEETRYCIPSVADTLEVLRDSYFSKVINPLKMPKADKDKLKETQAKVSEVRKSIRIKNAQKRNCRNALTKELAKPDCDKSVAQILNAQIEDCDRDIAALYRKAHTIEKEVELLMQGGGLVDAE